MRIRKDLLYTFIVAASVSVAQPATAEIGEAVAVIQETTTTGTAGPRLLEVGAPLDVGDLLESGPIGQAQLRFVDDTKMVLGPNSALTLDTYLLRNPETFEKLAINTLRGSFRFISGNSASKAYSMRTVNATIGVRGTALDISSRSNASGILAYKGHIRFCNEELKKRECMVASPGDLLDIDEAGRIRRIDDPEEKLRYIHQYFPYAFDQSLLLAEFRLDTSVAFGEVGPARIEPTSGSPE
jgi:hypothetical protein